MAEVILASKAGFCFGVNKAIDTVYGLTDKPAYTYGPIIHNDEVTNELANRQVYAVSLDEAKKLPAGSTIVIRSHGISKEEEEKLKSFGLNVIDATCPFVKKIHNIVQKASNEKKTVVVVGDKDHPEVKGIMGWSGENTYVVKDENDAEMLPDLGDCVVVSQTTFNSEKLGKTVEKIRKKCYHISVMNTICNATHERQAEAAEIAGSVDAMIVVGGRESSNTRKLYDICASRCKNTYLVQTVEGLKKTDFPDVQRVGITAGASTPDNIIQEVLSYVRTNI